jgi:hypothetical protein
MSFSGVGSSSGPEEEPQDSDTVDGSRAQKKSYCGAVGKGFPPNIYT